MRRLRYILFYLDRIGPDLIFEPFFRWLFNSAVCEAFDGIKIVDFSARRNVIHRFQVDTLAALRLIKSVDPRRFKRIQRQMPMIVSSEYGSFATYKRIGKRCEIDYNRFDFTKHPEWYLWWYATVLVHEATHGAIYSRQIHYIPRLRARIERLCETEARRFATRADTNERHWSDALVKKFDEKRWHDSWYATPLQRTKKLLARILEERRKLKK